MTDTKPPSGTPQPHRRRRRDIEGTPAAILGMLMMVKGGKVDPDMAAIASQTTRQTILQAIHRLRDQGLVIETHPTPPGPFRVQWYRIDDYSRPRAWNLLAWWTEPQPEAWTRYKKQLPPPEKEILNDKEQQLITDVEEAHNAALTETIYQRTHTALTTALRRTKL